MIRSGREESNRTPSPRHSKSRKTSNNSLPSTPNSALTLGSDERHILTLVLRLLKKIQSDTDNGGMVLFEEKSKRIILNLLSGKEGRFETLLNELSWSILRVIMQDRWAKRYILQHDQKGFLARKRLLEFMV